MKKINVKFVSSIVAIFTAVFFIWLFVRPMNIFVVDEKFERPVPVSIPEGLTSISAIECKECHEENHHDWEKSLHSKMIQDIKER